MNVICIHIHYITLSDNTLHYNTVQKRKQKFKKKNITLHAIPYHTLHIAMYCICVWGCVCVRFVSCICVCTRIRIV